VRPLHKSGDDLNESDPGTLAYVALILWVPICIGCFFVMRPERAALVGVLGALLFLPEGAHFKFSNLPPLTKENIPYLAVLAGAVLRSPRAVFKLPKERWFLVLSVLLILGCVGTAFTNGDSLRYGKFKFVNIAGLTLNDGLFTAADQALHAALPFFLGVALFRTSGHLRDMLAAFAIAGLVYVPFALVEIRMSPQFHYWVYGYHQHSFLQTMRWGGYRPMVFMSHGLSVARFFVVAALAALLVAKERPTLCGIPSRVVCAILFVTLILCKSTGAIAFGAFGLLIVALGRTRLRQTVAVVLAVGVLLYPALRAADAVPVAKILETAGWVDSDREQSLSFRFDNEDALLNKARERIMFGWGEYNRSAIFDEMARPSSVTDGHWIVLFGVMGVAGFVTGFGILLVPVFLARRRIRRVLDKSDRYLIAGVGLLIALIGLDLIPNGLFANYPYLMAGALAGVSRALAKERRPVARTAMVRQVTLHGPAVAAPPDLRSPFRGPA
jgi:hypothetical protein